MGETAHIKYDWYMLAATLACTAEMKNFFNLPMEDAALRTHMMTMTASDNADTAQLGTIIQSVLQRFDDAGAN
jgi:hypothetical protein